MSDLTIQQTGQNPVVLKQGDGGQLDFTVTSTSDVTETITVTLPHGVYMPGQRHLEFHCSDGYSQVVFRNFSLDPLTSVEIPGQAIETTMPADCFYSLDIRAADDAALGDLQGQISADGETQAVVAFRITA